MHEQDRGHEQEDPTDTSEHKALPEKVLALFEATNESLSRFDNDECDTNFGEAEAELRLAELFLKDLVRQMRRRGKAVLPDDITERIHKTRTQLLYRIDDFLERSKTAPHTRQRHKMAFVFAFTNFIFTAFWIGWSPETYYKLHTAKIVFLVGLRFIAYRWQRWHYYLLDLCYFVNAIIMVYIWCFPQNAMLWKVACGMGGILGISVPVLRNSVVLHSVDKITSLEIHLSPILVLWTTRWWPAEQFYGVTQQFYFGFSDFSRVVLAYWVWASAYYLKLFVISAEKIERLDYWTLYRYFYQTRKTGDKLPLPMQRYPRMSFILLHFLVFCVATVIVPILGLSYEVHTFSLIFIVFCSIFNGASFYIDHFAKHYENHLKLLQSYHQDHHES